MRVVRVELSQKKGSYDTVTSDSIVDILGKYNDYYTKRGRRHLKLRGQGLRALKVINATEIKS